MKVLIIEDDAQLYHPISEYFSFKSFECVIATNGLKAMHFLESQTFDLYVIDINVPEINGLELLRHIRTMDIDTPVVIITASLEIKNFTHAYELGCNEYIKKPFHLKELDIRVNNLLANKTDAYVSIDENLQFDLTLEEFVYNNTSIPLRYKEKRLCKLLVENANKFVSVNKIHHYVWEGEIKENYPLRQLIAELRRKLPSDIIQSKIRVGYMLNATA